MTRAAVYVRLSELDEGSTSPARQRADCGKVVADAGWDHDPDVDLFEDLDLSAYSGVERPAWERLLEQLPRYDVVVGWKVDRMFRSIKQMSRFLDACETHQVRFVTAKEGDRTGADPASWMSTTMLGMLAEFESRTISLRVRSAQDYMARSGRWRGGVVPFGWRVIDDPDEPGKRLALDDAQAALVREAAERVLAGESGRAIANDWTLRGIPTVKGGRWSSKAILTILRSPRMVGQHIHRGEPVLDDDGLPAQLHPPILDRVTWERVRRALSGRDRRHSTASNATLLSGLVRCGRCGGPMAGWTADNPRASYACSRRAESGSSACPGNSISRQHLDALVTAAVLARLDTASITQAQHAAPAPTTDRDTVRVGQLRDALDRLEADRLELGLYDDPAGRQAYAAKVREYRAELTDLLQARQRTEVQREVDALLDDVDLGQVEEVWQAWGQARRRAVIAAVVEAVTIGPSAQQRRFDADRVTISWAA